MEPNFEGLEPLNMEGLEPLEEAVEEQDSTSKLFEYLGAPALGAAQGLTMGFADEILAGFQAPFSDRSYDELLQEQRNLLAEAEEVSPVLTMAGDIAGTAIPAFLSGGTSLAAKAGATGAKALLKSAGKGATIGATEGLGRSEESITESPKELAKDVAAGAALGGIAGPLIEKGVGGIKSSASNLVPEDHWMKRLFEYGEKNIPTISKEGKSIQRIADTKRDDVVRKIEDTMSKLSTNIQDTVKAADNANVSLDISGAFSNAVGDFTNIVDNFSGVPNVNVNTLSKFLESLKISNSMKPSEVVDTLGKIQAQAKKLKLDNEPMLNDWVKKLSGDIKKTLHTSVPGYDDAVKNFNQFATYLPENMLADGTKLVNPQGAKVFPGKFYTDQGADKSSKLLKSYNKNLGDVQEIFGGRDSANITRVLDNVKEFYKTATPELQSAIKEKMGANDIEGLVKLIRDPGIEKKIMSTVGAKHLPGGTIPEATKQSLIGIGISKLAEGVHLAGRGAGLAKRKFMPIKAGTKFVYDLSQDQTQKVAKKLLSSNNASAQRVGQTLADAVANNDQHKRNTALFLISQQEDLNDMVKGLFPDGEEE